jgi:hypothetical protein
LKNLAIITLCLALLPVKLLAQKEKVQNDPTHDDKLIHFGFSLGLNSMDYRIKQSKSAYGKVFVDVKDLSPGINIHAIGNLRLAKNFDLRMLPGISFGERFISFKNLYNDTAIYDNNNAYKAQSSYLELPILIKYKSKRINNFRPYLIGGGNIRYDLAVKKEYDYKDQLLMIKPLDFYAEIGVGSDFYLAYFKLGVELKFSIGLTNILLRSDRHGNIPEEYKVYTDLIDNIYSQIFILSFHFE